ncbi:MULTISPECIES: exosporium protein D [Bacillus]|uniref:exosporium protein D n=1 Tax=Bacillus TaxID=1386 RepID=UPI000E2FBDF2|nr:MULTISPECIES: exosporium protein D [Bacillus]MBG0965165.1 exosporium protein D [Bacillus sp. SRB1LM]RFB62150.1 exosporium protein D [Bacillus thuringiensis]
MADYFYKDGKKYYKKQENFHSYHSTNNCFIDTHTIAGFGENLTGNIPLTITILPGAAQTIFEDFTENPNSTFLQLSVPQKELPMTVTIRSRNSNSPITVIIPTDTTRFFQVENFESLTVSTPSSQPGFFSLFIKKTFCICCNDQCNPYDKNYHDC